MSYRGWRSTFVGDGLTGGLATGETVITYVPPGWKGDGTRRAVIWCHGYSGSATFGLPGSPFASGSDLFEFAKRGYLIALCDLGGGATFGNALAQTRLGQVWSYVKGVYGCKTDQMVLYCASMGADTALNYALANPANVAAIGGFQPLVNIDYFHDVSYVDFEPFFHANLDIEAAYTNLAGYEAALAASPSCSPHNNAALLDATGIPMMFGYGEADTVCPPAYTEAFDAAIDSCEIFSQGPINHGGDDPTRHDLWRVLTFLRPYIVPDDPADTGAHHDAHVDHAPIREIAHV